nr:ribonuclease H-like domain-containing protein [Tanacetum cinerariifolium]
MNTMPCGSKYKTAQELWAAILKTFGGNEATKKTKKNLLKQQYGNFKAEGSETLEQTFNRLQVIVSQLEFMDIEIKQDDLNQNSGNKEVNIVNISTASTNVSTASANIGVASISQDSACAYIASQSSGSQIKFKDINQIDEDDIEEMDIKWNMALLSMRADKFWKRTGKKISIQGTDSYMANDEENHALVADEEAPTEFALMAKTSAESEELEIIKKEKEGLESKLTGFQTALKDLDSLLESQRLDKNKKGLGYSVVPPPPAQVYSPPKKGLSWTGLLEFADDTVTDYSRPSPAIESTSDDAQNRNPSVTEIEALPSTISPKPFIKFVKATDRATPIIILMTKAIGTVVALGGCKITSKGTIKIGKLEFENVYFVKDLKYTLFSVSQICDNKNSVLLTDSECIVLGRDFKMIDDTNVLLRTPRQHNMYSIDLNNIVLHKDLTCLVAKASTDEGMLWHKRLGHLNFKTMNRLVRHNLVRGLPSKCFENDHNCTAYLKGKQHKASLTDDFSRCDNGGEFRNKEMDDFCSQKGIKREFCNARTPQQKGAGERRNRTLIEAIRTMLADAKLLVTFWAEAVNTTCYVQNRVLVNKSHNKTLYELFNGRIPAIGFLKPFGCHVMILNTLDHLGMFEEKGDEGFFIGYFMSSKAFRVFNKRTKRVEENLHVDFLENKAIEKDVGPNWLFDIDSLTKSMNYVPVVVAGTISTNFSGKKDATSQEVKKDVSSLRYIALPNWIHEVHLESFSSQPQETCNSDKPESKGNSNPTATSTNPTADQLETLTVETPIPAVSLPVLTACLNDSLEPSSDTRFISKRVANQVETSSLDNILTLTNRFEDILGVTTNSVDSDGVEADEQVQRGVRTEFHSHNLPEDRSSSSSVLAILMLSISRFTVYQLDVKSAFLYGTIDEEVYVMQPPGFQDPEFLARVYKVEKAIYGLRQAPRAWYGTLSKYLLTNGVQRGDILKKFRYSYVRSANTPMDKENPWGNDGTGKDVDLHLYRSMIGSLMYLTASRPDIMFTVCAYARHQVTPKECHLHAVKRIFRYLKGHPKLGLWYPKESPFDLVAYSDSDYGGATQDCKSTTRGCQFLGRILISWQCKKQTIVATSTTE